MKFVIIALVLAVVVFFFFRRGSQQVQRQGPPPPVSQNPEAANGRSGMLAQSYFSASSSWASGGLGLSFNPVLGGAAVACATVAKNTPPCKFAANTYGKAETLANRYVPGAKQVNTAVNTVTTKAVSTAEKAWSTAKSWF
jgi:hypothetical protein